MMPRISVIVLLICSSIACKQSDKGKSPEAEKPKSAPSALIVDGMIAKSMSDENELTSTGTILANEEAEIRSEISGRITKILFQEGSKVVKNQLLVQLDDSDLIAEYKKLEVQIQLEEVQERRQKQLLDARAVSTEDYELTAGNLNILKANKAILDAKIAKTKIYAPFSGIAGLRDISVGAIIQPTTTITQIQNVSPLKLQFTVPEKYNQMMSIGKRVSFTVAGYDKPIQATIYAKDPKIDPVTRSVIIRAKFDNNGRVAPGAFANVSLENKKSADKQGVAIPSIAFIPDISGAKVFLYKNGKVASAKVKAGIRTEKDVEIIDGINVGDTVITSGILQIKPDMPVNVNISNIN